jgi:NADH:ubiquinone oxidoreductase subunit 6 (subunit J)
VAGAVLLGLLTLAIGRLSADPSCCAAPSRAAATTAQPTTPPAADALANDQVARLGGELFGRHLLAVEVAGVLLLVALIGAIAVVSRGEAALEEDRRAALGRATR